MTKVVIEKFAGIRPSVPELQLDNNEAVIAEDVDIRRSVLSPRVRQLSWSVDFDPSVPTAAANTTALLLHFDELQDYIEPFQLDEATGTNVVEVVGTADLDDLNHSDPGAAVFGAGGANMFYGSNFFRVTSPSSLLAGIDTATLWSIECFVGDTDSEGETVYIFSSNTASTYLAVVNGYLKYHSPSGDITSATLFPTTGLTHAAVCRDGATVRLFQDGVEVGTALTVGTDVTTFGTTNFAILSATSDENEFDADEMRVVVGEALFTAGFTPPVAAYEYSGGGGLDIETLYRYNRFGDDMWIYWITDVDVAPGPVVTLSTDLRRYYTGDGLPKMWTAESVDDVTTDPDAKWPYEWFYLGVPAPTTAPTIAATEYTPPVSDVSGEITSLATGALYVRIDKWNHKKTINNDDAQNSDIYDEDAIGVALQALTLGARMVVTAIIDEDNVRVNGQTGDSLFRIAGADYGLRWDSITGRTLYNSNYQWNFYVPNTSSIANTLEAPNHELQVGDVIRISSTPVPLQYQTTAVMTVNAADKTNDNVSIYQRVNPTSGTIEFTGSINYVIERGGTTIDPGSTEVIPVDTETRSYVYTFVSHLSEEGPPSPASDPVVIEAGTPVTLSVFDAAPTDHRNITNIRIYRAITGSDGTEFQFVAEIAADATDYEDTLTDEQLGELLPSEDWDLPPENLQGIVAMPNGSVAGFFGNVVCFSEPGFGHAWPQEYQYAIEHTIIGLAVIQQALIVLTDGYPYVFSGSHPRQMSPRRTSVRYPCIDKRSVVNTGDSVIYASPVGLVRIEMSGAEVLTSSYYTKEKWAEVVGPEIAARKVRAWFYDDIYIIDAQWSADPEAEEYDNRSRLLVDMKGEEAEITTFTEEILAGYYDPAASEFIFAPDPSGDMYPRIDGAEPVDALALVHWGLYGATDDPTTDYVSGTWASKTFAYDHPVAPAAARAVCRRLRFKNTTYEAHGLVQVKIYGVNLGVWDSDTDAVVDESVLVSAAQIVVGTPGAGGWAGEHRSAPFRVPGAQTYDAVRTEIIVEGPVEVETLSIAEAMEELMSTP